MYIKHDWFVSFLEKSISGVFGRINLHKKGSRNMFWFLLKKVKGQFVSTALEIDTFYVKYCSVLTQ